MGTTALRQTSKSRDFFLVLFFCLIGILARLILIGQVPYGLNQDEASAGYEAWSILNYGIDRHGISYPVHLIAWGSGLHGEAVKILLTLGFVCHSSRCSAFPSSRFVFRWL